MLHFRPFIRVTVKKKVNKQQMQRVHKILENVGVFRLKYKLYKTMIHYSIQLTKENNKHGRDIL